jgi:hypothetical protein
LVKLKNWLDFEENRLFENLHVFLTCGVPNAFPSGTCTVHLFYIYRITGAAAATYAIIND